jgi:hypothetical protein
MAFCNVWWWGIINPPTPQKSHYTFYDKNDFSFSEALYFFKKKFIPFPRFQENCLKGSIHCSAGKINTIILFSPLSMQSEVCLFITKYYTMFNFLTDPNL